MFESLLLLHFTAITGNLGQVQHSLVFKVSADGSSKMLGFLTCHSTMTWGITHTRPMAFFFFFFHRIISQLTGVRLLVIQAQRYLIALLQVGPSIHHLSVGTTNMKKEIWRPHKWYKRATMSQNYIHVGPPSTESSAEIKSVQLLNPQPHYMATPFNLYSVDHTISEKLC